MLQGPPCRGRGPALQFFVVSVEAAGAGVGPAGDCPARPPGSWALGWGGQGPAEDCLGPRHRYRAVGQWGRLGGQGPPGPRLGKAGHTARATLDTSPQKIKRLFLWVSSTRVLVTLSVTVSTRLSVRPSLYPSVCLSVSVSVCLYFRPSLCPSVCMFVYLCVTLSNVGQVAPGWCLLGSACHFWNGIPKSHLPGISDARAAAS